MDSGLAQWEIYFGNWLALLFYFLSLSVSLLNPCLPALMLNGYTYILYLYHPSLLCVFLQCVCFFIPIFAHLNCLLFFVDF